MQFLFFPSNFPIKLYFSHSSLESQLFSLGFLIIVCVCASLIALEQCDTSLVLVLNSYVRVDQEFKCHTEKVKRKRKHLKINEKLFHVDV